MQRRASPELPLVQSGNLGRKDKAIKPAFPGPDFLPWELSKAFFDKGALSGEVRERKKQPHVDMPGLRYVAEHTLR